MLRRRRRRRKETILGDSFAVDGMGALRINNGTVDLFNLPTSDPGSPGRVWNDGGTLKVSL